MKPKGETLTILSVMSNKSNTLTGQTAMLKEKKPFQGTCKSCWAFLSASAVLWMLSMLAIISLGVLTLESMPRLEELQFYASVNESAWWKSLHLGASL